MAFSNRRGRPKKQQQEHEATEELLQRFDKGITQEPLDRLLQLGLISERMHAAGVKFRWLHTIRFGVRDVSSLDLQDTHYNKGQRADAWYEEKAEEYKQLCSELRAAKALAVITDMCIFNKRPAIVRFFDENPEMADKKDKLLFLPRRSPKAWVEFCLITQSLRYLEKACK